jgi:predicted metalloprotease with PDZ domain
VNESSCKQEFLDEAAEAAAALDHTPGQSWRRSVDYYPEGFLIWLEADTVIREQTHGQKSLNDFCRLFHGGQNTPPEIVPYTFEDLVKALNQVLPYDWTKFLRDRLDSYGPGAPLGGIINGGWKLAYDEHPSEYTKAMEKTRNQVDARFSIGLALNDKGEIRDVIMNSPAWKAGIAPGSILLAVNGRKYTPDILRDALAESKSSKTPLELLVSNGDFYKVHAIDYHDGERYAHLVRDESKPDVLSEILKPLAK